MTNIQAWQREQFKLDIDKEHFNRITAKIRKVLYYAERRVFDVIAKYSVKYMGVSYLSNKSIASLADCSLRTVQNVTKSLYEKGYISKIHTYKGKSQTSNTIVINPVLLFDFVSISKQDKFSDNCTGSAPNTSLETNSFKQEDFNDIKLSEDGEKLARIIKLKVNERNISHLSSYVDAVLADVERDVYYRAVKANKHNLFDFTKYGTMSMSSSPVPVGSLSDSFNVFKNIIDGDNR